MKILKKYARAKINLGLEILNKNNDGYHSINTVFKSIDLFDEMTFRLSENEIETNLDSIIPKETNLIYIATRKIFDKAGYKGGVQVDVNKIIPQGAGLGGGSTDAASTLQALNILCDLRLSYEDLFEIAKTIGADVPYFLKYGAAEGKSRGEKLKYFSFYMPYYILLVHPSIHVSTKEAYQSLGRDENFSREVTDLPKLLQTSIFDSEKLRKNLVNDFEPFVFESHTELSSIKDELYKNGAIYASMSGSGSSLFGLFTKFSEAKSAESKFSNYFTHISYPGF
ncbi:MAG: 4-(cytidine 5'-diphospho)-2-C-methyl-D-erythritol kinase [Ignavibacteriae bacterium HGW-Ignavibacteriae-1]|jgi:4-diphosphocytidyl-2-C-methyl-D-erythritol kinase|nr:MAG: 4-(cytidine 5'-diphospho)-2-C-methyl-D-erythritol kinase [Ignavibacteriae bacterium HGW-Ignavibacteriae-1]